jgi:uncharacterized alkaline shock family protein YloU
MAAADKDKRETLEVSEQEKRQKNTAYAVALALSDLLRDTSGVYRISGSGKQNADKKNRQDKPAKGVRVSWKDNALLVNLHVAVAFGAPLPEIARQIQNEAKELILRRFPGHSLSAVNISVSSVRFDQESLRYREEAVAATQIGG